MGIETRLTLAGVLAARAREHPERTAYIFLQDGETEADRRTYAALDARARAVVARLQERGAEPGDRALLLYPPGLEFIDAFFGCLYAGVVAVPCYPPRPGRDQPRLKAILADAGARFALCTAAIAGKLQPLWLGATCVLMSPVAFLRRPRRWLEAISRYRGTTSGGPSFAYELCAEKIGAEDLHGLDLSS